jgi:hypothetical protein
MCFPVQKSLGGTVVIKVTRDHLPGLQRFGAPLDD